MRFRLFVLLAFPVIAHAMPGYFEPWGKDTDLRVASETQETLPPQLSLAAKAAEKVIRFRQVILSPVDGPRSHFRPTSSQYMLLAIRKHGFLKGYIMGCDRLLRENSDDWVYRKIEESGKLFKYDPPP